MWCCGWRAGWSHAQRGLCQSNGGDPPLLVMCHNPSPRSTSPLFFPAHSQAFRDGVFNVLVCTSIGEEGLDISQVSVCFFGHTEVGLVVCCTACCSVVIRLRWTIISPCKLLVGAKAESFRKNFLPDFPEGRR